MSAVERYKEAASQNKEIVFRGLTFHPLKVKHYALYRNAKPSMELMLSSLPIRLARMSWCGCLDAIDQMTLQETGHTDGLLLSILLILNEALNLRAEIDKSRMQIMRDETGTLKSIVLRTGQNQVAALDMAAMSEVRQILAIQNDYTIPNEAWNPELVRAQAYLQSQQKSELKFDLETLVYSVALNSGKDPDDVWDWPIRKFERMQAAIDRRLCFEIYTKAELGGHVKFKHGNPCPSWKFDRVSELPGGFQRIDELDAGANGLLKEA